MPALQGLDRVKHYRQGDAVVKALDGVSLSVEKGNLLPALTALDNVLLPLRYLKGSDKKVGRARALELLAQVGLADRAHHRPDQLSGGQQQRVAIARSLVNKPALVLGDEPTGSVDTETSQQLVALMRRLNRDE